MAHGATKDLVRLATLGALAMLASAPLLAACPRRFQRGVTISCWGWGAEWQAPGMAEAMDDIRKLGANAISFHPYAWIRNDGRVEDRRPANDPTVLGPLAEARRSAGRRMKKERKIRSTSRIRTYRIFTVCAQARNQEPTRRPTSLIATCRWKSGAGTCRRHTTSTSWRE